MYIAEKEGGTAGQFSLINFENTISLSWKCPSNNLTAILPSINQVIRQLVTVTNNFQVDDWTRIRYAKLTEAVKQSLLEMQSLALVLSSSIPYICSQLCSLLRTAECYLTKKGLDRGRLSTWPWTSYYGALFPKPLLWVWGQTTLAAPPLISLTGLSPDPVAHCLMEPVSAPRDKFNQAPR